MPTAPCAMHHMQKVVPSIMPPKNASMYQITQKNKGSVKDATTRGAFVQLPTGVHG